MVSLKKEGNIADSKAKIKKIVEELKSQDITRQDILLGFLQEEEALSKIFDQDTIDTLEKVTKHLKDIKSLKLKPAKEYTIPVTLFSDRKLSTLEHLTAHLKENYCLNYKQIAVLLNRDQRTIWTTYQRAKGKKAMKKTGEENNEPFRK